jgi:exopolysaccharide production protein ExoY
VASIDNISHLAPPVSALPVHFVEAKIDRGTSAVYFICKRVIDVLLSSLLLLALLPLILIIAVMIKLDSPGPVLFAQERVGAKRLSGRTRSIWVIRTFRFYKFRSMVQNADQSLHELCVRELFERPSTTSRFKLKNDVRITGVGRLLRKTSLDELPQLVNVLRGDMSLVGPRPVPIYEAALYQGAHCERLAALPGITGLWQATARCRVPVEEMIRMDIEYARRRSLVLDLKILLLTIPTVLSCRGAD